MVRSEFVACQDIHTTVARTSVSAVPDWYKISTYGVCELIGVEQRCTICQLVFIDRAAAISDHSY